MFIETSYKYLVSLFLSLVLIKVNLIIFQQFYFSDSVVLYSLTNHDQSFLFQTTMFSFGAKSTASGTTSTGGLFSSLSKPQTSTPAFSFNPTSTAGASQPATGLNLNFGSTTGTSTAGGLFSSQPASGSTGNTSLFGAANPAKSSAPSLFGGLTSTSTSTAGGLFGAKPGTSGGLFGSSLATQPVTASTLSQFKGLGGTDSLTTVSSTTGQSGIANANQSQQPKLAKEAAVPPELLQHVEALKKHIAEEKKYRDEIGKNSSAKPLFEIQSEISSLRNETVMAFSIVQRSLNYANSIKEEFNRELKNFEMISRVRETPITLQDVHHNPIAYFQQKTDFFFNQMVNLSDQLHLVEKFFTERHGAVTTEEFVAGLHQINEVFIGLVGKFQVMQEKVSQLKTEYLHYRKVTHRDSTDVFKQLQKESVHLNLSALSPTKYPDVKSLEKGGDVSYSGKTNVSCTVGPNCFTAACSTNTNAVIGKPGLFAGANVSSSGIGALNSTGFSTSLFGTPSQSTTGGLFGAQPSLGVTFGSPATTSPSSKPGTKRNKSK